MKVWRLRAFPKTPHGGNLAGVVLDASTLTEEEMQQIAHDVGYSETAFVLPSDVADFRVRFFTPTSEVNLCGHATIATFNLLRDQEIISVGTYTQETKAGILRLDVQEDLVYMEQNPPAFYEVVSIDEIAKCFEPENGIDQNFPTQVVSTGLREIFVPIRSVKLLHELHPNLIEIERLAKQYHAIGIHAFALAEDADAYGRNFAPVVGIDEESATGTSNGALSCYLYKHVTPRSSYVLRQGYSMNQPSEIQAKLDITNGHIQSVWVGGSAITIEKD